MKIRKFGGIPESAFCEVLRTLESQYSEAPGLIRAAAGLLTTARDGLDGQELYRGVEELGVKENYIAWQGSQVIYLG